MMRVGAVRARPDDHELDRAVALGDDGLGDVGGHLALGASCPQPLVHAVVHRVDGVACSTQFCDLFGVLDHPPLPQHRSRELEAHAQSFADRDDVQGGKGVGDTHPRCGAHGSGDQCIRVFTVDPVGDGESELAHRSGAHLRQLHPRHHDRRG